MTTKYFSPNKIVIYVSLLSAALITALFISHTHKPETPILNPDDGTIFSLAREIKPFNLVSDKGETFKLNNFYNHWTLLFFGFTHCENVCPTTLSILNRTYRKLETIYPNLQVVLISLDPERDNPNALASYVRAFNPQFIGVSGKISELRKLQSQLGIFSARDNTAKNYQIQHTSSVFLINPKGEWSGMFRFGLNPERLSQDVITSVKALS